MLTVGCAGFPVGRDRYWRELSFVEALTGEMMPRSATLTEWRSSAPAAAEFSVQAHHFITHGREDRGFPPAGRKLPPARQVLCGGFRECLEAHEAWQATKAAADVLRARIILFETPVSFQPGPDRLRDMYRFFKSSARGRFVCVWRPHGSVWAESLLEKVCGDLGLIRSYDPLKERAPARGAFRYLRPRGPRAGGFFVDDLSTIAAAAQGAPSYLVFTHRDAFRDAQRLIGMKPGAARPRPATRGSKIS